MYRPPLTQSALWVRSLLPTPPLLSSHPFQRGLENQCTEPTVTCKQEVGTHVRRQEVGTHVRSQEVGTHVRSQEVGTHVHRQEVGTHNNNIIIIIIFSYLNWVSH